MAVIRFTASHRADRVAGDLASVLLGRPVRSRLLRLRANSRRRVITAIGGPRWWQ